MTITSVGYEGTVDDEQWANMVPRVGGAFFSVDDFGSFRVTAAAGTRAIQVAGGGASAWGVYDRSNGVETTSLTSVPSGVRWDLVVLRRDWEAGESTIVVIPGGSVKELPTREDTPGEKVDQPLALVPVSAGSSVVGEIVDLRCSVHNGGAIAWDDLARTYLNQLGTDIRIGDVVHSRVTDASGAEVWASSDQTDTGWVSVPKGSKWLAVTNYPLEVRRVGMLVEVRGAVRHSTGAVLTALATLPSAFRPKGNVPLGATHSSSTWVGEVFINAAGVIGLGDDYRSGSFTTGATVMLHGSWFRG